MTTSSPQDAVAPAGSGRTIDDALAGVLAGRLIDARRTARPIPPLSTEHVGLTADDAYAVQQVIVGHHVAAGETIVGWKLGLTSQAMQTQLGVDQPDYAAILSGSILHSGNSVSASALIAPRVEMEIAVILREALSGPVGRDEVLAATAGVAAAVEVIDSRIADWKIGLTDTIADLASTAHVLVSETVVPIDGFEPRLVGCILERDGTVVASGAGGAALGDPIGAVAWASETLGRLGVTMAAGAVIMTGALHASVPIRQGDRFDASFDRLGRISLVVT